MLSPLETANRSEEFLHCDSIKLSRRICAIRIKTDATGHERLAELAEIGPGCAVQVCGPGYNYRTVRILLNGEPMFVFEQDLVPLQ